MWRLLINMHIVEKFIGKIKQLDHNDITSLILVQILRFESFKNILVKIYATMFRRFLYVTIKSKWKMCKDNYNENSWGYQCNGARDDQNRNKWFVRDIRLPQNTTTKPQSTFVQCVTEFDLLTKTDLIKHDRQCFIGISKHWEKSWKYDAQRSIFDEIRVVWIADETLSRVFDKQKWRNKRNKIVKIYANLDRVFKLLSQLCLSLF